MLRYTVLDLKDNYALEICKFGYHKFGEIIVHKGKVYKVLRVEGKVNS